MLGVMLERSGDPASAAQEFRRAIAIDPRNARAYNNLGNALRDMGQTGDALSAYRRAAALAPQFDDPRQSASALLAASRR